jgi:hypothetical protein
MNPLLSMVHLFVADDARAEVRVLGEQVLIGRSAKPATLARMIERGDGHGNVYVTLNPLRPELPDRPLGPLGRGQQAATDADVMRYRWLPIDLDARGPRRAASRDGGRAGCGRGRGERAHQLSRHRAALAGPGRGGFRERDVVIVPDRCADRCAGPDRIDAQDPRPARRDGGRHHRSGGRQPEPHRPGLRDRESARPATEPPGGHAGPRRRPDRAGSGACAGGSGGATHGTRTRRANGTGSTIRSPPGLRA